MKQPELLAALGPVVDAFDALEVRYYVGGSVADLMERALGEAGIS